MKYFKYASTICKSYEPDDTIITDLYQQYFYSIKDISIGGRCFCNGHASACDTLDSVGRLQCTCEHNTCGAACDECCPGFVQKEWRPATLESSNECERKCLGKRIKWNLTFRYLWVWIFPFS